MNLEEIAKLSGVSRSTVSRVINQDPNVSEITRERVMAVIKRVDFHPNAAARGLVAGRTRILGIVIPEHVASLFTDPYFPILIQGVAQVCNANDHFVMLWLADPEYERRTIRQIMHSGLIDGVIVSSMLMDDPVVHALMDGNRPFVTVGRYPAYPNSNYVDVDNVAGAREGVLHLLRLGRRRIATITGPQNMIAGIHRLEGYMGALRERGFKPVPELNVAGDFTEESGRVGMQRLLPHKPDAVFAASDVMALGALRAIQEAGLHVPEDIALVSFDDMPFAARTNPPLTTVRQPVHRLGSVAAETLIELIEEPDSGPRHIVLPTELVIRSSCGASLL
jgi:LacI family transcriptional regulator